ncbi:MAG: PilZ domain-containing protein [Sphingomicrobium sp.]
MNDMRSRIVGGRGGDGSPLVRGKVPSGADATRGLKSVSVPRETSRTSDSRDGDRHRLPDGMVLASHSSADHQVQLINLSGGGAMISGPFEPKLWDRVLLHLGDEGTIECAVRWLKGDRIGLEFAHETRIDCSPEQRDALLRQVIARNFPDVALPERAEPAVEAETVDVPMVEPEHRRHELRHPLIWSGTIHYDHDSTPVRLRNISSQGAMIESSATFPEGAEPLLDLGEAGTLFATVSWVHGDQVGLTFHEPFDLDQLARSKPEVAPSRWEKPAYLRSVTGSDSPWDEHWQRLSLGELNQELDGFLKR